MRTIASALGVRTLVRLSCLLLTGCAEEEQRSIGRMFQGLGAAFQGNHQHAYPSQPRTITFTDSRGRIVTCNVVDMGSTWTTVNCH